jgi:hypothetical protein
MTAARIAYYVLTVQVSLLVFVAACYLAGHEHGWGKVGDVALALVAWLNVFSALGSLRRDKS